MSGTIRITSGDVSGTAELNDSATARKIYDALPLEAQAQTWGDEIYFSIPMDCGSEGGQEVVEMGDLGYWPPGSAFCIFFGRTPMSRGNEIRPASPVSVFGKIVGDATIFKKVRSGARIRIEKA
jgi:hypothetical protein